MLEIERVLREAHANGECRWGCPVCKEWQEEREAFKSGDAVTLARPDGYHISGIIEYFVDFEGDFDPVTGKSLLGVWSAAFVCADDTAEDLWLPARDLVLVPDIKIDTYETDVTMRQVKGRDDYDLQFWLEAWAED